MPAVSLAIIEAAVAAFLFGAIWFRIFGRTWMLARGWTKIGKRKIPMSSMLFCFLAEILMAIVLASFMAKTGATVRDGMMTGGLAWLGFLIPALSTNHLFAHKKLTVTMIEGGHWLGVLLVEGLVLGLMS